MNHGHEHSMLYPMIMKKGFVYDMVSSFNTNHLLDLLACK